MQEHERNETANSQNPPNDPEENSQGNGGEPAAQRQAPEVNRDLSPEEDSSQFPPAVGRQRPRRRPTGGQESPPEPQPAPAPTPAPTPAPQQISQQDLRLAGVTVENIPDDLEGLAEDPFGDNRPSHLGINPQPKSKKLLYIGAAAAAAVILVAVLFIARNMEATEDPETAQAATGDMDQVITAINQLNANVSNIETRITAVESQQAGSNEVTDGTQPETEEKQTEAPAQPTGASEENTVESTPSPMSGTEEPQATITTAQPEERAQSQPEPEPTAFVQEQRPGICSRSPVLQEAILTRLSIQSCRAITPDELFRIIDLPQVPWTTIPKPGDFTGLVNLNEMNFEDPRPTSESAPIPANTFVGLSGVTNANLTVNGLESRALTGMDKLVNLTINMPAEGRLHPGAFQSLPELENLVINVTGPTKDIDEREFLPIFDRMPRIRTLSINTTNWAPRMKADQFRNLHTLQSLTVKATIMPNTPVKVYWLPASLFRFTTYLSEIDVTVEGPDVQVKAPPELVENLDHLRYMSFTYTPPEGQESTLKLALSLNSPLLQDITSQRQSPIGFEPVLPQSN